MAPVNTARRRLDDDDEDGPFDRRYPGKRVIADGGKVRVPVFLTDGMPPDTRAAMSRGPMLFDASKHRPHYAVVDASDPNVRAAERARDEYVRQLQDAWKTPSGKMAQPPDNGNGNGDDDDDDDPRVHPADEQRMEDAAGPSCA